MYSTQERIGASRTDPSGYLKLSEAANMIQDCSIFWLESEPSFQAFMTHNNLGLLITSRQIDVLRLPKYKENVIVQTRVYNTKSFVGYRNTGIYDADNKPCILTWSTGVLIRLDSNRVTRFPKEEADKLTLDEKIDMPYLDRKIFCSVDEGLPLPAIPVRRNDIDFYNHMNNAKYLEVSLELIPIDFPINRVRIEYRNAAKLGDTLYPILIDQGEKQYIILADGAKSPYSIIEFT
ncbi:MAG: thioesterase [Peptococcaceae bacterium]|nr:thioesterase [Peptococcaceae bacterium]